MKLNKGLIWASALLCCSSQAVADIAALNDAAHKMCEKSKMCAKQQMAAAGDLPPGMEAMMTNALEEMCKQYTVIAQVGEGHEIVEPATDCLNSLASMSCDQLMNSDGETAACQRYEAIAEKY
ncbi:hypothetical protein [Alteromonas lipolytica]|uniref:Uncharacterized protein n=1 Tax=Alteromonas lipolytica TaxID=1856405 RepID=A0A1E8FG46_9ALTE|nr:hypothetical protein [Alteromonas lipolytica]OFI34879.1 hypothetical protein BFC17_15010 [Alteromonas lipolytica]GGF54780.1 hypothetical protein GCM10011338_03710 [Alteromonas lipolytica]